MEACEWVAIYDDNTTLKQHNVDGSENLFKDIDQDKLVQFALITPKYHLVVFPKQGKYGIFSMMGNGISEFKSGFTFDFDTIKDADEFRLVFFKRQRKDLGASVVSKEEPVYNVGVQATVDGTNHVRLLSYDNGELSIVDKK